MVYFPIFKVIGLYYKIKLVVCQRCCLTYVWLDNDLTLTIKISTLGCLF